MRSTFKSALAVFAVWAAACTSAPEPTIQEVASLTARIKSDGRPSFVGLQKESSQRWQVLAHLYQSRDFRPVWIARGRPLPKIEELRQLLSQASQHGLRPENYDMGESVNTTDHELELTWALIQFSFDIAGRGRPVERLLAEAIENDKLSSIIDDLVPGNPEYARLQQALPKYLQLADDEDEGWQNLPLEVKLQKTGDLNAATDASDLTNAIKQFETRHGFRVDGRMDNEIREEINISPSQRVRQIAINLERLRKLPSDLGRRYIWVNIPEFKLTLVEEGQTVLSMKVVVGRPETPTPTLDSRMTHIVFSPYWNIPESILTNETLPKIVEDENYLEQQDIEIVRVSGSRRETVDPAEINWSEITSKSDYQFRQRPGAKNALGLVKFIFPNPYSVYLHDTPADGLFRSPQRGLSHGCVRVEDPMKLAEYLLRDDLNWTSERIRSAMHSGRETTVLLKAPEDVHLAYLTAWATPEGFVHFRRDIYGLDDLDSN